MRTTTIRVMCANGERLTFIGVCQWPRWWERMLGKPIILKSAQLVGGEGYFGMQNRPLTPKDAA